MITYQDIKSGAVAAPVGGEGLSLALIQIDGGTQSRATLNQHVVDEYAEAIEAGATFPPIVVYYDGKKHWLADGFHRFHAYQKVGREKVAADVRQGTRRDAILHSVGANETHGLRRTRDDKRRAVLTLLNDSEWSNWTDRQIANACLVDHKTVAKVRSEVTGEIPSERTYVTKHGTTATMKTAGINASRATAFRAENAQKSGDDDETKSCPQTLAAQGVEGDDKAEIAVSGSYPRRTEAVADADAIQIAFDRASNEGRALFLARNNLRQEAYSNAGGGDVDRSATRASSAVEVGATNSPDGAAVSASSGRPEGSERLQVQREPRNAAEPDADQPKREEAGTERGVSPCVTGGESAASSEGSRQSALVSDLADRGNASGNESVTAGETASNSQSTVAAVEAVAGNPQAPREPATANTFQALSKADQIKLLRPHCQHPGSDQCGGSGRNHCHACKKLMESEAA